VKPTNEVAVIDQLDIPKGIDTMKGTNGGIDYVVFGHRDNFKAGYRPLYDPKHRVFAFRIRVEWSDKSTTPFNFKQILKMTFQTAPFSKVSEKHGSFMGGLGMTNEKAAEITSDEELVKYMRDAQIPTEMLQSVAAMLQMELDHEDKLLPLINDAYEYLIKNVNGDKKSADPVTSKSQGTGDVVPFPGGKTDD